MTQATLAIVYAALASLPLAMHIALAFGAPLGRFTVGGRFAGRLPGVWRWLAVLQACLLLAMTSAVLDRGGVVNLGLPGATFWGALGLTILTTIANLATPSRPERLLWGPVTLGMTAATLGVALIGKDTL